MVWIYVNFCGDSSLVPHTLLLIIANGYWLYRLSCVEVRHEVLDAEHSDALWFQCYNIVLLIKRTKWLKRALRSFNFDKLYVVFGFFVDFGHIEVGLNWTVRGLNNLAQLQPFSVCLSLTIEVRLCYWASQVHLRDIESNTLQKLSGRVSHQVVFVGLQEELSSPRIDVKLVGLGSQSIEVVLQVGQPDHDLVLLNSEWNQLQSWRLLELFVVFIIPYFSFVIEGIFVDVFNLYVVICWCAVCFIRRSRQLK